MALPNYTWQHTSQELYNPLFCSSILMLSASWPSILNGLLDLLDISFPGRHINDSLQQFLTAEDKKFVAPIYGCSGLLAVSKADNLLQYSLTEYIYKYLNIHLFYPVALTKTLGPNNET
ncbi:hypothetical protein H112_03552 [Trichophyton rubrum D6]|uniref:Uncharacterized protein n=2 Tax=Trichophyton rubrum TaxID=5551 RepID=F2SQL5_TRIRC|nr:uncharacterized protein TERG_04878 [Trichophyton rubrum CBS 118892]EZF23772.1 hypothetical protein H100_03558 [Trichophyton rubrum MR850]EZF42838.1 hypothetical protein H102_03551 [Trichophyton rubrum CBS 100081]EZF53467.1 hypothetical protein H103_03561 [Trichophyton rubrum CBS 288.86]EZF64085.1 hypothetical protein H104_03548 [Trichophyton rubrum CBS 289.86]EZF85452.1 hypothetical protein H110_03559 [Trichophyton rubrum MR1448]EZF96229.1 hypothetical protein H113_03579 [Trichophyton rubr